MGKWHSIEIKLNTAHAYGLCLSGRGLSEQTSLGLRAKDDRLVEPYPNLYARPQWWNAMNPHQQSVAMIRSLSLRHHDWVFCALSAACMYNFQHAHQLHQGEIHIATTGSVRRDHAPQLKRHHIPASQLRVEIHHGISLTTELRTLFDCSREYDFISALPIVDSALATGAVLHDDLIEYCETPRRGRGRMKAARVAQAANPYSENGGESMCRAVMIQEGFQTPKLQTEILDPIEPWKQYRTDFLWELPDGTRIAGEYDGKQKYLDHGMTGDVHVGEVILQERLREQRLMLAGIDSIIRFDFSDIIHPQNLVEKMIIAGIPRCQKR